MCIEFNGKVLLFGFQIVIESASSAVQYASLFVHSQKPINASIVFDLPHEHLYLATLTKVRQLIPNYIPRDAMHSAV